MRTVLLTLLLVATAALAGCTDGSDEESTNNTTDGSYVSGEFEAVNGTNETNATRSAASESDHRV